MLSLMLEANQRQKKRMKKPKKNQVEENERKEERYCYNNYYCEQLFFLFAHCVNVKKTK